MFEIENTVNKVIPNEIKKIILTRKELDILVGNRLERFIVISPKEILKIYREQEELFDYDIIPFASLDDDYLCLYYQHTNISIIYWSSERALESKKMAIFELNSSYIDFCKKLYYN